MIKEITNGIVRGIVVLVITCVVIEFIMGMTALILSLWN
jgi:hypothetical protein